MNGKYMCIKGKKPQTLRKYYFLSSKSSVVLYAKEYKVKNKRLKLKIYFSGITYCNSSSYDSSF